MEDDLLLVLDRIVGAAHPGEGVEAYGVDGTETTIRAHEGEVESLTSARSRGVGVRMVVDGRVGYAYSADLSERALVETVGQARENARFSTPDEANVLPKAPGSGALPRLPELYDDRFEGVGAREKVGLALQLEAAARGAGSPVKGVDSARYGDTVRTAAIASTAGVRGSYRRCDAYVIVEVLAEADGATTSAYGLDVARVPSDLDVDDAAAEGVLRATRLLGGRKPPSARIPVLFDPFVTASFLGVLSGALSAESVQKGRSLFVGRLGDRIGPDHVTLIDDGSLLDGLAAAPWDGEGVATGRTPLVSRGVLEGFLHNTYTAAREGAASTGNASRGGYTSTPGVSPTNLWLEPGELDPAALLRRAGTAFYCQQVMGLHSGANAVTGDFSVGAAGVMVRDGAFAEPVREATIAGTIPGILEGIEAVGSDLRWLPFGGSVGGSTLLVEGMTVAGS